nr:PREDICTED: F-box/kelch-repeat protein At3g23880-like [Daucus carota subsp. sativus]XP_017229780.1 PREDICTED: F-box/kelch-repeat protein At3g23880-like [Daucus carota subsp. sativus]XP_017229781.1 PREDICTED: F-box/kelch-repeat protein At3g23880-like [Daucus carota subsp. sativus]XP_017229782.1 PREDICTED: F-box/kelch-repeat protein At3g23880-like [Daucus carota subsp. sativus]XP_017229783.1 PREDICTED: F-box/kelch-repeat protein At3g23880-like [Daucus carota subsp. sativus]XP_017229784.1 PREDI
MAVREKLKRKKTVAADLPGEVVYWEILTRLPIKSAVRFKCVSKSWLSQISSPKFAKRHLTCNATQNPSDYDRLIAQKENKIVILSHYNETFALPFSCRGLVGSVRGLVCLSHDEKLSLWNPAIHQSKEFTLPPNCFDYIEYMGFGFDPVSNNFKVVLLSSDFRSASVYNSDSDSWTNVFVPDNVHLLMKKERTFLTDSMTIVKDCPYWRFITFAKAPATDTTDTLTPTSLTPMKFDAGSNDFILLPEFHFDTSVRAESDAFSFQLVDMNDHLTLIFYDQNSSNRMLDIYSLKGEEGSCVWSRIYSIGPLDFHKRHWFVCQGFYGGEIVIEDNGMFSCFDQKRGTIKRLRTTVTTVTVTSLSCFRYTPSMFFLEGMKSVYLRTQTRRTTGLCSRVPRRLVDSFKN